MKLELKLAKNIKGNKGCTSGANERLRKRSTKQGDLETKDMKKARIVSHFFLPGFFMGVVCPQASHIPSTSAESVRIKYYLQQRKKLRSS